MAHLLKGLAPTGVQSASSGLLYRAGSGTGFVFHKHLRFQVSNPESGQKKKS